LVDDPALSRLLGGPQGFLQVLGVELHVNVRKRVDGAPFDHLLQEAVLRPLDVQFEDDQVVFAGFPLQVGAEIDRLDLDRTLGRRFVEDGVVVGVGGAALGEGAPFRLVDPVEAKRSVFRR